MPPMVEVNPIIVISSFGAWEAIADWWWGSPVDKVKATSDTREGKRAYRR